MVLAVGAVSVLDCAASRRSYHLGGDCFLYSNKDSGMTAPIDFEERSALREYDGNMSREEAERLTLEEINEYLKQRFKDEKNA